MQKTAPLTVYTENRFIIAETTRALWFTNPNSGQLNVPEPYLHAVQVVRVSSQPGPKGQWALIRKQVPLLN